MARFDILMAHFLSTKLSATQLSDLQECIRKNNVGKTFSKLGHWYIPDEWMSERLVWQEFNKEAYPLTINQIKSEWSNKDNLQRVDHWLDLIKDKNDIYSEVLRLHLYAKIGNQGRVDNILEELLVKEPWVVNYQVFLNNDDIDVIYAQYLYLFKETWPLVENKKLWAIFINWMNQFKGDGDMTFPLDIPLPSLKKILRSTHYGLKFPGAWFKLIHSEFAPVVLEDFLGRSVFWKNIINEEKLNDLWILTHYFPKETVLRDVVIERWQKLLNNRDPYQRDYAIRMLNNEEFYQYIMLKKLLPRPLFILKREHYKSLLKTKLRASALFELIKLGESGPVLLNYFSRSE